jgi:hypothetical protein
MKLVKEKLDLFSDGYDDIELVSIEKDLATVRFHATAFLTKPIFKKFKIRNSMINVEGHEINLEKDFK